MTQDTALLDLVRARDRGVLTTLKRDGRPQLSVIGYAVDAETRVIRVSITDSRAKTKNLRRDPRASLLVGTPSLSGYVVVESTADLSPVAADPGDATADELVELYRAIAGEHPDWDEYRAAMVAEGRLVLRLPIERMYGWAGA